MSWLFGRRKQQRDSPADSTADSTEEEQNSDPSEGYVHVTVTPGDPLSNPSGTFYPYVPSFSESASNVPPTDSIKDSSQGEAAHYLNGVPFKLCKRLESCVNTDVEIDKLRISEVMSFIERMENQNYDYSFTVEEGVVAEMNSQTTE